MTKNFHRLFLALMLLVGALHVVAQSQAAIVQGTAFMYQGRLNANGTPVTGSYDLSFTLYNAAANGTALGAVTNLATPVSSGLFTVMLDFGNVFSGANYWLAIAARTNGSGVFTTLNPYQPLAPTPYAIFATTAGTATTAAAATNFSGSLTGDVTGTQGGTVVTTVGGVTAVNVANGANAANAAASTPTSNTIVKRDGTGNVAANSITLNGNLNLPATTTTAGIIYSRGTTLLHAAGNNNIFAGAAAGNLALTGTGNAGIGAGALSQLTSGNNNLAVGYQAGINLTTGSSNIDIGNTGVAGDTNTIRIGTTQTTTYLAGTITGNGAGLTGITPAQIGALSTNVQAVLAGVATNDDALLLHTNNSFSYHGVNYFFPLSTTACLQEIDSLFPKASNGVPSGISIRLDDNAEYEMTSFVTLTNNYKIVGGGPWTSGFCYCGPTNVCNGCDVMAAWQIGDNQVYPNVQKCTFLNFFPSNFQNWVGAFGVYQSPNLILQDFYVKTAQNFPCILMAVQAYDFYASRVAWYGADVITDGDGNFAQTFPMNLGDVPAPPAAIGLFTSVINQETIDDCTANELADGIVTLGNTWLNCRDLQAEDIGEFPVYSTTNEFGVGFGLYIGGNVYKAVVDSYAPYQNWVDIWVDGTEYSPPVLNNVIGGQDLQYGICVSGGNGYDTVLNFSFGSMPINEIDMSDGAYVVNPATTSTPIITFDGVVPAASMIQSHTLKAPVIRKP